jgi:hypothetical protein
MAPGSSDGQPLRILTSGRSGRWVAHAVRADNGDRFGPDFTGDTQAETVDKLVRWLEWEREHAEALRALQEAERHYHRTVTGQAFVDARGLSSLDRRDALSRVDAARVRLDQVRARGEAQ